MRLDDIALCTHSDYNQDGWIGIQVNLLGGTEASAPSFETLHPFGFISRPQDPELDGNGEPTTGCKALLAWDGDEGWAMPLTDMRPVSKLPQVQKGESFVYAYPGNFSRWHADGTISHSTTDNGGDPAGRSINETISPVDGFEWYTPWGRKYLGPLGYHLDLGSGASIHAGGIGGMPAPLDQYGSYIKLKAAMISLEAGILSLGTDGGLGNETAVEALITIIGQLIQAISLITTATPGSSALASAGLPPNGVAALPIIQPLLRPIGKIV